VTEDRCLASPSQPCPLQSRLPGCRKSPSATGHNKHAAKQGAGQQENAVVSGSAQWLREFKTNQPRPTQCLLWSTRHRPAWVGWVGFVWPWGENGFWKKHIFCIENRRRAIKPTQTHPTDGPMKLLRNVCDGLAVCGRFMCDCKTPPSNPPKTLAAHSSNPRPARRPRAPGARQNLSTMSRCDR
jgi:hypothetical protein